MRLYQIASVLALFYCTHSMGETLEETLEQALSNTYQHGVCIRTTSVSGDNLVEMNEIPSNESHLSYSVLRIDNIEAKSGEPSFISIYQTDIVTYIWKQNNIAVSFPNENPDTTATAFPQFDLFAPNIARIEELDTGDGYLTIVAHLTDTAQDLIRENRLVHISIAKGMPLQASQLEPQQPLLGIKYLINRETRLVYQSSGIYPKETMAFYNLPEHVETTPDTTIESLTKIPEGIELHEAESFQEANRVYYEALFKRKALASKF